VKFEIIDIPVRALMADLDAVVSSLAQAKSLSYECKSPKSSLFARTDPDKLRQIMINLLSNAVKFTPEGGRIRLYTTVREKTVSIHVQDTGPGIPVDKKEAVFEPFVQLDRGLTRTNDGTGLGLAISRGLARAMGADVTLEFGPNHAAKLLVDSLLPAAESKFPFSLYLVGLASGWVFTEPFETIPLLTGAPVVDTSSGEAAQRHETENRRHQQDRAERPALHGGVG
jgi:K+-sensing histidine kinase KdpD